MSPDSATTPTPAPGADRLVPEEPGDLGVRLMDGGSVDRMLVAPRAAIGLGALLTSPLLETVWAPGTTLVGGYLIAVSAATLVALNRASTGSAFHRISWLVILADTVAFLATFVLLGGTPTGAGMLLFPLLAFEVTLKLGALGALLGAAGLVVGILARMVWRVTQYGLPVRWHFALLVLAATALTVALGYALRARLAAEVAARAERDRIARSLRATVTELLAAAGVPRDHMDYAGLQQLLDLACTHPEVGPELGRRLAATLEPSPDLARLTRREAEILELLAQGRTDREIAATLFLSPGTVRVHVSNMMRKLDVASRDEAVELLRRQGRRGVPTSGGPAPAASRVTDTGPGSAPD